MLNHTYEYYFIAMILRSKLPKRNQMLVFIPTSNRASFELRERGLLVLFKDTCHGIYTRETYNIYIHKGIHIHGNIKLWNSLASCYVQYPLLRTTHAQHTVAVIMCEPWKCKYLVSKQWKTTFCPRYTKRFNGCTWGEVVWKAMDMITVTGGDMRPQDRTTLS